MIAGSPSSAFATALRNFARDGRHRRRADDRLAVGVGQPEARDPDTLDIGVDFARRGGRLEAGAFCRGDEKVAKIRGLRRLVGHRVGIAFSQLQLGHIKLERGVLREFAKRGEILIDPLVDRRGPAVGDDPEADLPSLEVAGALVRHETVREKHRGDDGRHKQDGAANDEPVHWPARFQLRRFRRCLLFRLARIGHDFPPPGLSKQFPRPDCRGIAAGAQA